MPRTNGYADNDYLGSDDLEDVLALSMGEVTRTPMQSNGQQDNSKKPSYILKSELNSRLSSLTSEVTSIDRQIQELRAVRAGLVKEQRDVQRQMDHLGAPSRVESTSARNLNGATSSHGAGPSRTSNTDYNGTFEWSGELKNRMTRVFGIQDFRLCQRGVCNANMDGRDIVCVMPTGGGKSLTYQLPALLAPGCTLVISPLISLITDQILHLHEAGIEAVMLTGGTSKEETKSIFSRLTSFASSRRSIRPMDDENEREIKLCYVTPEKIAKSKTFTSVLEKLATAGKLARIVIDEAHCVSQLGHDFRPDYKKLSILRQLFPRVPILALSATCPPKVLKDLLLTLRLKPVVDGKAADRDGTIYFSAPLYRKNLHYQVLAKPASAQAAITAMSDYILENHKGHSGIVYCLSKKDTETVAAGLAEASKGQIKTGVYHSEVGDGAKERLHVKWRSGDVQVVVATIAFGLGIDKGDVRFVLHHSMSKSLDGFYQESGRAGRDGKDSDCVLWFRSQDASRLSSLICGEIEGQDKLHDMLRFAMDKKECRKILFANYFSASSSLSVSAWSDTASNTLTACGHCDNCTRSPDSIAQTDVTLDSWRLCTIMERVNMEGGRLTVAALADLARGNGGGTFGVVGNGGGRKGKQKQTGEKVGIDLDALCGGKVMLSKDDTETLIIHLVLSNYLKEEFHSTAYSINVYVTPGPQSIRLTRLPIASIKDKIGPKIEIILPTKKSGKKASGRPSLAKDKTSGIGEPPKRTRSLLDIIESRKTGKQKGREIEPLDSGGDAAEIEDVEDDEDPIENSKSPTRHKSQSKRPNVSYIVDEDSEEDRGIVPEDDYDDDDTRVEDIWSFKMRDSGARKRPSDSRQVDSLSEASDVEAQPKRRKRLKNAAESSFRGEEEVVIISSD